MDLFHSSIGSVKKLIFSETLHDQPSFSIPQNFERLESRFQLRSVFRWNIEASVEGSHIFLRANEHT